MWLLATRWGSSGVCLQGIVTGTGADPEFRVTARCEGIHTNGAEGPVLFRIGGVIGKSILVPNIVSHLLAGAANLLERCWKIGLPASGFRDLFENLGSPMSASTVCFEQPSGLFRAQQADRVNHGIGFL